MCACVSACVCVRVSVRVCVQQSSQGNEEATGAKKTRVAISRLAGDAVSASVKATAGGRKEGPRGQNFSVCQPRNWGWGLLPC